MRGGSATCVVVAGLVLVSRANALVIAAFWAHHSFKHRLMCRKHSTHEKPNNTLSNSAPSSRKTQELATTEWPGYPQHEPGLVVHPVTECLCIKEKVHILAESGVNERIWELLGCSDWLIQVSFLCSVCHRTENKSNHEILLRITWLNRSKQPVLPYLSQSCR